MVQITINLAVLLLIIFGVHGLYIGFIRPEAALILSQAALAGESAPRDLVVILKDYEQEICIILMIWGLYLIIGKIAKIILTRYVFDQDLLEGMEPNDESVSQTLQTLEEQDLTIRDMPLIQTLTAGLRRYLTTNNVQNMSDAVESSIESIALRQDAENAMIRYLIWAIPSIGFIGTVRGIGLALSKADEALAGDIAAMTNGLGIAFNSTLVALLISIILMFFLNQLQRLQDGILVDTQAYCEKFLLVRISEKGAS